jgi:hypothetical protein
VDSSHPGEDGDVALVVFVRHSVQIQFLGVQLHSILLSVPRKRRRARRSRLEIGSSGVHAEIRLKWRAINKGYSSG